MPYYHRRKLNVKTPNNPLALTQRCNQPFVQVRCLACGKMLGLTDRDNHDPRILCSPECVESVPCALELNLELMQHGSVKE